LYKRNWKDTARGEGETVTASVIFNITAISDGATQVFKLKAEGIKYEVY
jgi:hypothetical protein